MEAPQQVKQAVRWFAWFSLAAIVVEWIVRGPF